MSLDPLLLDVLACPVDKGPLLWFEDEDVLYNPRLQRATRWSTACPCCWCDEAVDVGDAEHERLMAKAEKDKVRATGPADWVNERAYLDTLGMWEAAAALPEQLSGARRGGRATRSATALVLPRRRGSVAVRRSRVRPGHRRRRPARRSPPSRRRTCRCRSGSATGPRRPGLRRRDTLVLAVSSVGRHRGDAARPPRRRSSAGPRVVAVGGEPAARWPRLADDAGLPWCPVGCRPAAGTRAALGCGDDRAPAGRPGAGRAAARLPRRRSTRARPRWPAGATRWWRRAAPGRSWPAASAAPSRSSTAPPAWPPWRRAGGRPR